MMLPFSDSDFATMVDSSFTHLSSISALFYHILQAIVMQFFQGVVTVADKALSLHAGHIPKPSIRTKASTPQCCQ